MKKKMEKTTNENMKTLRLMGFLEMIRYFFGTSSGLLFQLYNMWRWEKKNGFATAAFSQKSWRFFAKSPTSKTSEIK